MSVLVAGAQQHAAATAALVVEAFVYPFYRHHRPATSHGIRRAPSETAPWNVRSLRRLDPVPESVETGAVSTGG